MGTQQQTVATAVEQQRLGYNGITLTNFTDAASAPAIAAGSKVEIAGSLFLFSSEETITNWTDVTTASTGYIKLTVTGTAVAAAFTGSTPVWSESKQGYYASAASNERMIGGVYKAGTSTYQDKWLYQSRWQFGEESGGEMVIEEPGLVIKQGASDGKVFQLRSTDVAHALTSVANTCTYGSIEKASNDSGGMTFQAITDTGIGSAGTTMLIRAYQGGTADTTTSTAGRGVIELDGRQHDGADTPAAVVAAGNLLAVRGDSGSRMIVKGNADMWLAGSSLSIDGGTDSDARIEFASDADILWDESETEFYLNQSLKVDNGIETDNAKIKVRIVDLGEWDMSATASLTVNHFLTAANIRSVTVFVRPDSTGSVWYPINYHENASVTAGGFVVGSSTINPERFAGQFFNAGDGAFDATASTVASRGYAVVTYIA